MKLGYRKGVTREQTHGLVLPDRSLDSQRGACNECITTLRFGMTPPFGAWTYACIMYIMIWHDSLLRNGNVMVFYHDDMVSLFTCSQMTF